MLGVDVREAAARVADEVLLLGEDPEHARPVLVERDDAVARDFPRIAGVVDGEPNAVESRDAVVGAEPEVAVAGLDERGDGIDRQPVGDRPVLADVRSRGRDGLSAGGRPDRHEQRGEKRELSQEGAQRGGRGGGRSGWGERGLHCQQNARPTWSKM